MVPSDVSVMTGSSRDRVIFELEYTGLGVWKMTWTETMSGSVMNGDEWHEQMRIEFSGTTTDGKAPRPNRSLPSPGNDGFLQPVPSNVLSDSLDLTDFFIVQPPGGDIAASSHVHFVLRRQIDRWRWTSHRLFPGCLIRQVHCQPARSTCGAIRM